MQLRQTLFSIVLAGALVATPAAPAQSVAALPDSPAMVRPGDVLKITVWRNQELSGDVLVGADGALQHPLYREVKAAGVPLDTVEQRVRQFLSRFESNPQVVVVPMLRVIVGGEVRIPNLYLLPRETTIAQAIAQAGGATERGRLDKVMLVRGGQEIRLDLRRPNDSWASAPIQSGDQLVVSRQSSFFRSVFLPVVSTAGAIASIIRLVR